MNANQLSQSIHARNWRNVQRYRVWLAAAVWLCALTSRGQLAPDCCWVPQITSIMPNHFPGSAVTNLTVTGSGFYTSDMSAGTTHAYINSGSVEYFNVINTNTLTIGWEGYGATLTGTVATITIQNVWDCTCPTGQSASNSATVTIQPAPGITVTSISPPYGPVDGGTKVTITGTGFAHNNVAVWFVQSVTNELFQGGFTNLMNQATDVVVNSSTTLTCLTPKTVSRSIAAVQVVNPDGKMGTLAGAFMYELPAATITKFTETFVRTLRPATKNTPPYLVDRGLFTIKGSIPIAQLNMNDISERSHLFISVEPTNGVYISFPGIYFDQGFEHGSPQTVVINADFNNVSFKALTAKLSWNKQTLNFTVNGQYKGQMTTNGVATTAGYWIMAPTYVNGPKMDAGLLDFYVSLTVDPEDSLNEVDATALVPYVEGCSFTFNKTHTVTNSVAVGVVGRSLK